MPSPWRRHRRPWTGGGRGLRRAIAVVLALLVAAPRADAGRGRGAGRRKQPLSRRRTDRLRQPGRRPTARRRRNRADGLALPGSRHPRGQRLRPRGPRDRHHPRHARPRQRRGRARRRPRPRDRPRPRRAPDVVAEPGRASRRRARGRPHRHGHRLRRRLRPRRPGRRAAHAPCRARCSRRPSTAATRGARGRAAATTRRSPIASAPRRRALGGRRAEAARARGAYLSAIDGLVFGDGQAQGFVRGASFVHPDLRFAFDPPPGYALANEPGAIVAEGPGRGDAAARQRPRPGGDPAAYIARSWAPEIAMGVGTGGLTALRALELGGLPAARARLPLASDGSRRIADLTVVRYRGRLYRLTGLYRPGDAAAAAALARAAASFRPLTARRGGAAAAAAHPHPPHRRRRRRGADGERDAGRGRLARQVRPDQRPLPRPQPARRRRREARLRLSEPVRPRKDG